MILRPPWKAAIGLCCYLAGTALAPVVLERGLHPIFIVGGMLTLYGAYLSTVKGIRDWGDAVVWVACALPLGVGLMLMFGAAAGLREATQTGLFVGGGIALVGWMPLRQQGALPGGPSRD